jgi:hypothetical protein
MQTKPTPDHDPLPTVPRLAWLWGWRLTVGPDRTPLGTHLDARRMLLFGVVLLVVLLPLVVLLVATAPMAARADEAGRGGPVEAPWFFGMLAAALAAPPVAIILGSSVVLVRNGLVRPRAGRKPKGGGPSPPRPAGDPMRDRWLDD